MNGSTKSILLISLLLMIGCDGRDKSFEVEGDPMELLCLFNPACLFGLAISSPTSASSIGEIPTDTSEMTSGDVVLKGQAFVSPTDWRCCPPDPGVSVVWSNAATGRSGTATSTVSGQELGSVESWTHTWQARVPLAVGDNPITVRAFDQSGHVSVQSISVRRAR